MLFYLKEFLKHFLSHAYVFAVSYFIQSYKFVLSYKFETHNYSSILSTKIIIMYTNTSLHALEGEGQTFG